MRPARPLQTPMPQTFSPSFLKTAYATCVTLDSVLPAGLNEALGLPPLREASFSIRFAEPYGKRPGADADHYGVITMISNDLHYQFALLLLLAKRDIDMATWRYAAWNRPIAVCGRTGSWVVDAPPEALNTTISQRALVQFLIGMLMVAGAVGWLANTVEGIGFAATLSLVSLKAVLVIVLGVVLALDATALGIYRWVFMSCPSRAVCQKRLASFKKEETSC